ncbi:MAG: hypothetical protein HKO64_03900 [Xanthomonadales bacterium]|nr:hypothetical protein [Xanthomonadales bacterium]
MPDTGGEMPIKFENTSGGVFSQFSADAVTDSDYGDGTIRLIDCERLALDYQLDNGQSGEVEFHRILPDYTRDCAFYMQGNGWQAMLVEP